MDFGDIFKIRDASYARLTNAVDYLGRALRENVVIFDIDSTSNTLTLLSESQHLLHCEYVVNEDDVKLDGFKVRPADEIMSDSAVDAFVAEKISAMVAGLSDSRYDKASDSFGSILETFKNRHSIMATRAELTNKLAKLNENTSVVTTKEYSKLSELKDTVKQTITENAKTLSEVPDIRNSIRINNALSKAFDVEKTSYEDLIKEGITLDNNEDSELYSLVCRRELVAREIYESKRNFSNMWVANTKVKELVSCMFTEEAVEKPLASLVKDVPYFALASKSELNEAFTKICAIDFTDNTTKKMIREFTSTIFEMKKPAKKEIISSLSENYGININSLKYIPTFSDLAKVQGYLFKALSENTESEVLKELFAEAATMVNGHCGVEVLDLSDYIKEVFVESMQEVCGHDVSTLNEAFDMEAVGAKAATIIEEGGYYGDDDHDGQEEMDEEDDNKKKAKKKGKEKKAKQKKEEADDVKDFKAKEKDIKEGAEEEGSKEEVEMSDEDLAAGGVPNPDEGEQEEDAGEPDVNLSEEEAMQVASDMEDIISQLKVSASDADPESTEGEDDLED